MKANYVIGMLILAGLLSCQHIDQTPKPDNLIPEEKMVNILVDMAKLNAAQGVSTKNYRKRHVNAKELMFEKYDIDILQLIKSNNYYAEHFDVNARIYDSVRSKLQLEKKRLEALERKSKEERAREKAEKTKTRIQKQNDR